MVQLFGLVYDSAHGSGSLVHSIPMEGWVIISVQSGSSWYNIRDGWGSGKFTEDYNYYGSSGWPAGHYADSVKSTLVVVIIMGLVLVAPTVIGDRY